MKLHRRRAAVALRDGRVADADEWLIVDDGHDPLLVEYNGIGRAAEVDVELLVALGDAVAIDGDRDHLTRLTGVERERPGGSEIITAGDRCVAVGRGEVDGGGNVVRGRKSDDEGHRRGAGVPFGDAGVTDAEAWFVIDNGDDTLRVKHVRIGRAGEVDIELLIGLRSAVAFDRDEDRLACLTGTEGECSRSRVIVPAGDSCAAVGCGKVDRHRGGHRSR